MGGEDGGRICGKAVCRLEQIEFEDQVTSTSTTAFSCETRTRVEEPGLLVEAAVVDVTI